MSYWTKSSHKRNNNYSNDRMEGGQEDGDMVDDGAFDDCPATQPYDDETTILDTADVAAQVWDLISPSISKLEERLAGLETRMDKILSLLEAIKENTSKNSSVLRDSLKGNVVVIDD